MALHLLPQLSPSMLALCFSHCQACPSPSCSSSRVSCTRQSPDCLPHHADPGVPLTTLLVIRAITLTSALETIQGQGPVSLFLFLNSGSDMASQSICRLLVTAEGHPPASGTQPCISLASVPGLSQAALLPHPLSTLPYSVLDLMSFRHGALWCHTACPVSRPSPRAPGPALVLWCVTEFDKTTFQPCGTGGFSFPPGAPINPSWRCLL